VCSRGAFEQRRHDAVADVLGEMYKAVGGLYITDHQEMNTANTATFALAAPSRPASGAT